MIGLGVWQLQRRAEKEATLALVAANPAKPPVAFPAHPPVPPELLFRRSSAHCLRVVHWRSEAGRAADGSVGYRYIAECATGAERSEEHTSELQSLKRNSYAVFCVNKKNSISHTTQ